MASFSVYIAPSVVGELREAMNYIIERYYSPAKADALLDSYDEAVAALEAMPLRYPIDFHASTLAGIEIRRVRVGAYKLLYIVNEEERHVDAISLIHERQDYRGRFLEDYRRFRG